MGFYKGGKWQPSANEMAAGECYTPGQSSASPACSTVFTDEDAAKAWEEFTESVDCMSTGDAAWYAFRAGWLAAIEHVK